MRVIRLAYVLCLAMASPAVALTPTPTVTPCTTFAPPHLSAELNVEPEHPVVGDQVVLTFHASGSGGLPQYTLVGGDLVLAGSRGPVSDSMFGNPVRFELTAEAAGTATVALRVNFETVYGCVDDPIFQFVVLTSDPFAIEVVAPTPTATTTSTPTETPTPTPVAANHDDDGCATVPPARARHAALLLLLPVVLGLWRRFR